MKHIDLIVEAIIHCKPSYREFWDYETFCHKNAMQLIDNHDFERARLFGRLSHLFWWAGMCRHAEMRQLPRPDYFTVMTQEVPF